MVTSLPFSQATATPTSNFLRRGGESLSTTATQQDTSHHGAAGASLFASSIGKNNNHKKKERTINSIVKKSSCFLNQVAISRPRYHPASRKCGQVISISTVDQMKVVALAHAVAR
jgi:hypothetical protein